MKIRIFALAKELGLDSKVLIDYASEAGVQVKNSALASVSADERDTILRFIDEKSSTKAPPSAEGSIAPKRDVARDVVRKIRSIDVAAPRSQNGRGMAVETESAAEVEIADAEKVDDSLPQVAEEAVAAVAVDEESPTPQPEQLTQDDVDGEETTTSASASPGAEPDETKAAKVTTIRPG
ncbi:MAG: translation initiation factor IF-2 N-terminal domain-containing protein, partial [Planctomycetes bacterium]|nr:translation initiation factor IF-2 N-terminal domain-containing protein [Planctomycetota bacterium]